MERAEDGGETVITGRSLKQNLYPGFAGSNLVVAELSCVSDLFQSSAGV